MDPVQLLVVALIGAGVGFLGGAFGKGGSAVATPLLAAIGIPPIVAVASPLPAVVPGTLVAARSYWREGLVDRRVVGWGIAAGLPATVAGAIATRWIGGGPLVLASEVIVTLLGLRVVLFPHDPHEIAAEPSHFLGRVIVVGILVGIASGLLANSGGFLLAPLYVVVLRLPIKAAFASSLAVSCVLAVPGTIVHAWLGHIDWAVTLVFAAASIPLSHLGARVALRTSAVRLERVYGAGLMLLGAGLLAVSHSL